ncbi:hypothetical protein GQ43DRAFT_395352 [Delitschia confertaspora ATCC 74209]|uniref:NADH-ubiquinone oxidoreductase 21kDa subunit N-terminal domain-containing protein n=1 Tax=Delitschia confertaspora ATCC 74209 TaxID=1513339 RepID=A0A9P4JPV3_9PLEO|nr:hypothetical protein GQ43DRAFT_395352 [Delitschia confertaspora ATCC 74209]
MSQQQEQYKPAVQGKLARGDYPLIDSDPHFNRVIRYTRPSDWAQAAGIAAAGPALMMWWEKIAPTYSGKAAVAKQMRLSGVIGLSAGFFYAYSNSIYRFYGARENRREIDMDMREMVDKVKRGEPLYGVSDVSEYMQGVATRNSRYSATLIHLIPWFNFVNHPYHGVDTAKYYRQAELELEQERILKEGVGRV